MPFTGNEELKMQEGSVFLSFNYTPVKGSVSEEAKGCSVHLQQGKGLKMLFQSYYSVSMEYLHRVPGDVNML